VLVYHRIRLRPRQVYAIYGTGVELRRPSGFLAFQ
jgi:hypothetical protein